MKQDEAETILKTTTTKNWQKAWWERQNSFVGHPYHQVPHYLTIRWYFVLSCTTSIALYYISLLSGLINRTVDGESKNSTDTAVCASLKIELRQNRHQTSAVKAIQYNWKLRSNNLIQLPDVLSQDVSWGVQRVQQEGNLEDLQQVKSLSGS